MKNLEIIKCASVFGKVVPVPEYATPGSAALDIRAAIQYQYEIKPGNKAVIRSGFSINFEPGMAGLLIPRSGLSFEHGIVLCNTVGLIDSDYKDEIKVLLLNRGDKTFNVNTGDRVAQMLIIQYEQYRLKLVEKFTDNKTGNRGGGFGSTGVK